MQEKTKAEGKKITNSVDGSFTSIVWVVEAIDWTLVYWVFWLEVGNEDRKKFMRGINEEQKKLEGMKEKSKDETLVVAAIPSSTTRGPT